MVNSGFFGSSGNNWYGIGRGRQIPSATNHGEHLLYSTMGQQQQGFQSPNTQLPFADSISPDQWLNRPIFHQPTVITDAVPVSILPPLPNPTVTNDHPMAEGNIIPDAVPISSIPPLPNPEVTNYRSIMRDTHTQTNNSLLNSQTPMGPNQQRYGVWIDRNSIPPPINNPHFEESSGTMSYNTGAPLMPQGNYNNVVQKPFVGVGLGLDNASSRPSNPINNNVVINIASSPAMRNSSAGNRPVTGKNQVQSNSGFDGQRNFTVQPNNSGFDGSSNFTSRGQRYGVWIDWTKPAPTLNAYGESNNRTSNRATLNPQGTILRNNVQESFSSLGFETPPNPAYNNIPILNNVTPVPRRNNHTPSVSYRQIKQQARMKKTGFNGKGLAPVGFGCRPRSGLLITNRPQYRPVIYNEMTFRSKVVLEPTRNFMNPCVISDSDSDSDSDMANETTQTHNSNPSGIRVSMDNQSFRPIGPNDQRRFSMPQSQVLPQDIDGTPMQDNTVWNRLNQRQNSIGMKSSSSNIDARIFSPVVLNQRLSSSAPRVQVPAEIQYEAPRIVQQPLGIGSLKKNNKGPFPNINVGKYRSGLKSDNNKSFDATPISTIPNGVEVVHCHKDKGKRAIVEIADASNDQQDGYSCTDWRELPLVVYVGDRGHNSPSNQSPEDPKLPELVTESTPIRYIFPANNRGAMIVGNPFTLLQRNGGLGERLALLEGNESLQQNWLVEARERYNGLIDLFYHHKKIRFRCRSKIEVQGFEIQGIMPKGVRHLVRRNNLLTVASKLFGEEGEYAISPGGKSVLTTAGSRRQRVKYTDENEIRTQVKSIVPQQTNIDIDDADFDQFNEEFVSHMISASLSNKRQAIAGTGASRAVNLDVTSFKPNDGTGTSGAVKTNISGSTTIVHKEKDQITEPKQSFKPNAGAGASGAVSPNISGSTTIVHKEKDQITEPKQSFKPNDGAGAGGAISPNISGDGPKEKDQITEPKLSLKPNEGAGASGIVNPNISGSSDIVQKEKDKMILGNSSSSEPKISFKPKDGEDAEASSAENPNTTENSVQNDEMAESSSDESEIPFELLDGELYDIPIDADYF